MATKPRYGHVVGAYASAGKLRVDNCFSEFYYPNGQPTPLLAKAQQNLGITGGAYEPPLGNPSANGMVLSSTVAGVRSWIAPTGGVTWPLLAPAGTLGAPSYSFSALATTGFFQGSGGGGGIGVAVAGANSAFFFSSHFSISGTTGMYLWTNSTNPQTGWDTGMARNAAGIVEINNGTKGTFADLKARSVIHNGVTVATLPATPTAGQVAYVTDGTAALAWGATVTGGGSTPYLVWWNGSAWTVAGH